MDNPKDAHLPPLHQTVVRSIEITVEREITTVTLRRARRSQQDDPAPEPPANDDMKDYGI
jgi:hypothetical protein